MVALVLTRAGLKCFLHLIQFLSLLLSLLSSLFSLLFLSFSITTSC